MEDLNNRQIVLLTMLVSFVVSIATGIITVAMLEEAPQTMTQTVNRVVERTIERVVSGTSTPEKIVLSPVTTVTKEVTVYAKEDDLIVSAVEKNQPRIAKIFARFVEGGSTSEHAIGSGFIVSRDGLIVTSRASMTPLPPSGEKYPVVLNGKEYVAALIEVVRTEERSPVVFLKLSLKEGEAIDAVSFGREQNPKIAQTLIVMGKSDDSGIFKTTVAKLRFAKSSSATTSPILTGMDTAPDISEQHLDSLVVNLDGQAEGIVIAGEDGKRYVYPVSRILELVGAVPQAAQIETAQKHS